MGGSSKKKKEKAADFSKAKLKLGKGKQLANNATDTSFKARSIALPRQTVNVQKDEAAPTTKRNLSLDELISHLKHYSPSIRKDAIAGLKEILKDNVELIDPSLNTIINACVRLISDEDAMVRKSLLSFFSWLFPLVPRSSLAPHTSVLMLFTTSAFSHIFPEIRVDAVRVIDLLLEVIPQAVVGGWTDSRPSQEDPEDSNSRAESSTAGSSRHGRRVLSGYLALFDLKGKPGEKAPVGSSSSLVLSLNSKVLLLKSFCHFLRVSISRDDESEGLEGHASITIEAIPTWFFSLSFNTASSYRSFANILQPSRNESSSSKPSMRWQENVDPLSLPEEHDDGMEDFSVGFSLADIDEQGVVSWNLESLDAAIESGDAQDDGGSGGNINAIAKLAFKLHPFLVSTFLDAAPSVFTPGGHTTFNPANVELIWAVGEIAKLLYGILLPKLSVGSITKAMKSLVSENLHVLLGYMAPYFPFDAESIHQRDLKSEQLLQDLSLAYCELTSLLMLPAQDQTPTPSSNRRTTANNKPGHNKSLIKQVERVADYVVQALQGQLITASQPMGRSLSAAAYSSLLPTMWALLNLRDSVSRNGMDVIGRKDESILKVSTVVFDAILDHAMRTGAHSAVKRAATEFVARLYLIQTEPMYRGEFTVEPGSTSGPKFVEWILSLPRLLWELQARDLLFTEGVLLFLLRMSQRQRRFATSMDILELRKRLVPFLSVEHPSKGTISGPYAKITDERLRRLVLDVALTLSASSSVVGDVDELWDAVSRATEGTLEQVYWEEVRTVLCR